MERSVEQVLLTRIRNYYESLSRPTARENDAIQEQLFRTLVGRTEMIVLGGVSVVSLDLTYAFSDFLTGIILFAIAVCGVVNRIVVTRWIHQNFSEGVYTRHRIISSGLIWSVIIGSTGCVTAMSGDMLLTVMSACVMTGLAFGATFTNAGAPKFAKLQVVLIVVPFLAACAISPALHMKWIAIQGPVWIVGMFITVDKAYRAAAPLIHAQLRIVFLATKDSLTGLNNRAKIMEIIDTLSKRRVDDSGISEEVFVLFLELDGFKAVNDTFGHGAGDELLQAVANRLNALAGIDDHIGRLGGDEFAFVLDNKTCSQTYQLANLIVEAISTPFT
ncbi:sensor domain-containing diguanylate cyclase [Caballeronia sp. GAWG1-1]|uniref:sensor domain-containing diguanylate cyclase n=1 Tax=Caballeronia sp. GAWG1-1 TaxID=2921742 RepID=UPI002028CE78|nr:sensor domain-containing diguanylate cyclase [Caballeronia sp. GAWG1-1]